ncbi:helix-turn-helix domain-containing protein, partial [Mycolicibacter heraklionensis]|uniref:helix-turn-helix domain-containing protein n=1 Tax=Mycolicibacter heraklionensis TaxID=512402 RepID=UPI002AB2D4E3
MPSPQAAVIVLTDVERAELEGWARRRTSAAGLALRSRIVLAAADGESNTDMAARMGISRSTVKRWRNRFVEYRCDGLLDEPRPGRPRIVGDDQIKELITQTLESAPRDAHPGSHVGIGLAIGSRQHNSRP